MTTWTYPQLTEATTKYLEFVVQTRDDLLLLVSTPEGRMPVHVANINAAKGAFDLWKSLTNIYAMTHPERYEDEKRLRGMIKAMQQLAESENPEE